MEEKGKYGKESQMFFRRDSVLVSSIEVKKKITSQIITLNEDVNKKIDYIDDYVDHPIQGKVEYVGPMDKEKYDVPIEKGDIVYLQTNLRPTDAININGEVFGICNIGNIIAVKKHDKE
jgi:hypothetical protein